MGFWLASDFKLMSICSLLFSVCEIFYLVMPRARLFGFEFDLSRALALVNYFRLETFSHPSSQVRGCQSAGLTVYLTPLKSTASGSVI